MLPFLYAITADERDAISYNIQRLSFGDEQALERIYNICGGRLLSVAMGVTRNLELAKDCVQDSFVKVVRSCGSFNGGNGYAWLCTIVRNTALNLLKAQNRSAGYDIDGFFNLADGTDVDEDATNKAAVNTALKQLSDKERTAIWLKYYNDMTIREIAQELNLPRSSVFELIKRAEERLKRMLSP